MTTRINKLALPPQRPREIDKQLDAAGWGLFFVWVAIALLVGFDLGVALLGVGIITLGGQAARWYAGLDWQAFWIVVGTAFAIGGFWQLIAQSLPLAPILLLIAGGALLLGALRRNGRSKTDGSTIRGEP